ncbi:hypothetical protein AWH51_11500 [Clavibacter tessellarius]|uniref:UspA domain-containing protein n=1 Tax=Clavibacter tessellarius TaxID=31965 RepID=A0A154V0K4_9MICO|nr:hypothetical protein AWH51_11500 [Clavibacter michiganensis subsp. tessellarius]
MSIPRTTASALADVRPPRAGSRGHGGFVGLLLGSVSSACAEHAACPVLVMHAPLVEHEDPVSAGAEALGDGSRASDAPAPSLVTTRG